MKIFKPSRKNLPSRVVRTFERNRRWHEKNGYNPSWTVESLFKKSVAIDTDSFLVLIQGGGRVHHGNIAVWVFNRRGMLVDTRIYFHPVRGLKVPRKAFIGTPIVDGSKPMKFVPRRRKDSIFVP